MPNKSLYAADYITNQLTQGLLHVGVQHIAYGTLCHQVAPVSQL